MAFLTKEICAKFRDARRGMGLTQSALALEIGCKQSALSMFEAGLSTKISEETVQKLAKRLDLSLDSLLKESRVVQFSSSGLAGGGFCPSYLCPSNVPFVVDDRVLFKIGRNMASPSGGLHCAMCGELLETKCPSCGAPLNDGACCALCGEPYVACALPPGSDITRWARDRRDEINALFR